MASREHDLIGSLAMNWNFFNLYPNKEGFFISKNELFWAFTGKAPSDSGRK